LAVIDGNPGLAAALREWPTLAMQCCTSHKLRNVEAKAPARLREELAEEYRRMIDADSRAAREVHVIQAEEWSSTKQKRVGRGVWIDLSTTSMDPRADAMNWDGYATALGKRSAVSTKDGELEL
jgi:hypothetical protein